jgi:hypothetical protein
MPPSSDVGQSLFTDVVSIVPTEFTTQGITIETSSRKHRATGEWRAPIDQELHKNLAWA